MPSAPSRRKRLAAATFMGTLPSLWICPPPSGRSDWGVLPGARSTSGEASSLSLRTGAKARTAAATRQRPKRRDTSFEVRRKGHTATAVWLCGSPVHVVLKGSRDHEGESRMVDRLMPAVLSRSLEICIALIFRRYATCHHFRLLPVITSILRPDMRQISALVQTTLPYRWHHTSGASEYLKTGVGLCVPPMCLVDYKGFRIVAQVCPFVRWLRV